MVSQGWGSCRQQDGRTGRTHTHTQQRQEGPLNSLECPMVMMKSGAGAPGLPAGQGSSPAPVQHRGYGHCADPRALPETPSPSVLETAPLPLSQRGHRPQRELGQASRMGTAKADAILSHCFPGLISFRKRLFPGRDPQTTPPGQPHRKSPGQGGHGEAG